MVLRIIATILLIFFMPSWTEAQSIPLPDISGWYSHKSPIRIKVSESITALVGFEVFYQNPDNPAENAMVVMKSIPALIRRPQIDDVKSIRSALVNHYSDKTEEDLIDLLYKERSDPILYARWILEEDPASRSLVPGGDVEIWFQNYTGEWTHDVNKKVGIELMTGLIGSTNEDEGDNLSVGRKYSLDGNLQILRIDIADLVILLKGDKK